MLVLVKINSNQVLKLVNNDYLNPNIGLKHGKRPYTSAYHCWDQESAIYFSSCVTPFHSHNHIQLVFDTQNSFKVRTKENNWETYKSLIIKENIVHQLDTNRSVQLIIYVDPASVTGRTIQSEWLVDKEIRSIDFNIFRFLNPFELQLGLLWPEGSNLKKLVNKILTGLCKKSNTDPLDARVTHIEQIISQSHPDELTIISLAKMVHLSESRLRSLFRAESGISLYRYMLWHKIRYATNHIMAGNSVNDAAMDAGFTDSSHFHKMMVKIFGISPSGFLKKNKPKDFMVYESSALPLETQFYNLSDWQVEKTMIASSKNNQSGFWESSMV
jgi:AraC-like DNA-binding protein